MMYEYGMLFWYFLVGESKSRTAVEEYWDAESFVSAEDFLFLSEDILPGIDSAWE